MRVLVVGAGVAGLTLAAHLCRRGQPPLLVEAAADADSGYALGLYPFGANVLHELGLQPQLVQQSLAVDGYELADRRGRILQRLDLSRLGGNGSPMVMIGRRELVALLGESCGGAELRRGVTVERLAQDGCSVEAVLSDGSTGRFDAVVATDGISSPTRRLVFGRPATVDTGWTLLTWWCLSDLFATRTVREWWGRGSIFGAYPSPGRTMCAAGAPSGRLTGERQRQDLRQLLGELPDAAPAVGAALDVMTNPYRWSMRDARAPRWVKGRVALCGDAGTGFLPTAGVGASTAMRCAAALADELSGASAETVPAALQRYEKRCRSSAEALQSESRRLARFMFVSGRATSFLRDHAARFYPAELMLRQIAASSRRPF